MTVTLRFSPSFGSSPVNLALANSKAVTAALAGMVAVLIIEALIQWYRLLSRRTQPVLHETAYVATQWAPGFTGVAHGDD